MCVDVFPIVKGRYTWLYHRKLSVSPTKGFCFRSVLSKNKSFTMFVHTVMRSRTLKNDQCDFTYVPKLIIVNLLPGSHVSWQSQCVRKFLTAFQPHFMVKPMCQKISHYIPAGETGGLLFINMCIYKNVYIGRSVCMSGCMDGCRLVLYLPIYVRIHALRMYARSIGEVSICI